MSTTVARRRDELVCSPYSNPLGNPPPSMTEIVYFVRCRDFVKIGTCERSRLFERIAELQCGNPYRLCLDGWAYCVPGVEPALHRFWAPLRVRGEWFRRTPELLEFAERLLYGDSCFEDLLAPTQ